MSTPPIPPSLQVVLKHKEVLAAALASSSRVRGGGTWFTIALFAALFAAIWLGGLLTFWGVQQLPLHAAGVRCDELDGMLLVP